MESKSFEQHGAQPQLDRNGCACIGGIGPGAEDLNRRSQQVDRTACCVRLSVPRLCLRHAAAQERELSSQEWEFLSKEQEF